MSTAVSHLEESLAQHKQEVSVANNGIARHTQIIEDLRRTKQELEVSIRDIELALSLLRKI